MDPIPPQNYLRHIGRIGVSENGFARVLEDLRVRELEHVLGGVTELVRPTVVGRSACWILSRIA